MRLSGILWGRKIDITVEKKGGGTALHAAVAGGHLKFFEFLVLNGADLKRECRGLTALEGAAVSGYDKIVDFLIKSGARFDESGTVAKDCKFCGKVDPFNMLRCLGCKSTQV